jgi:hypothetical protein
MLFQELHFCNFSEIAGINKAGIDSVVLCDEQSDKKTAETRLENTDRGGRQGVRRFPEKRSRAGRP